MNDKSIKNNKQILNDYFFDVKSADDLIDEYLLSDDTHRKQLKHKFNLEIKEEAD